VRLGGALVIAFSDLVEAELKSGSSAGSDSINHPGSDWLNLDQPATGGRSFPVTDSGAVLGAQSVPRVEDYLGQGLGPDTGGLSTR
jgi:hypothetical protein